MICYTGHQNADPNHTPIPCLLGAQADSQHHPESSADLWTAHLLPGGVHVSGYLFVDTLRPLLYQSHCLLIHVEKLSSVDEPATGTLLYCVRM